MGMELSSRTYEASEGAVLVVASLEGGGALTNDQFAVPDELLMVRLLPPQLVNLRSHRPARAPSSQPPTPMPASRLASQAEQLRRRRPESRGGSENTRVSRRRA